MNFVVDLEARDDSFLARFAPAFKGSPTYIRLYAGPLNTKETDELIEIIGRNPSIQKLMVDVRISEDDAARLLALPLDSLGISETSVGDTLDGTRITCITAAPKAVCYFLRFAMNERRSSPNSSAFE